MTNVTTALLDRLQQRKASQSLALDEYRRGRTTGIKWARKNVLPHGSTAPITEDCAESPYNLGVIQGIADELRRFADRLDPTRRRSSG